MNDADAETVMLNMIALFPIEALPPHRLREAAWRHAVGLGNGLTKEAALSYMHASREHRRALLSLRSRVRHRLLADLDFGSD